ncbi:MAG TPA: DUF2231 domain-containing protein [Thermomicrobiales bacterium]|nr:DUF2231 domain-containing protein [Thermomicrobiales bacterium]
MESRAKLAGHAIHPMLIVFPLGLLATALIFDIVYLATGNAEFATASFWAIAAGVIGGLLAALFGIWDWLHIPADTRAKAVGLWHGGGNVVVVVLFIVAWLLRLGGRDPAHKPDTLPFILEVIGVLLALVTAWLGGELVERLGVGVDAGANLDAPSSLSDRPATASERPPQVPPEQARP